MLVNEDIVDLQIRNVICLLTFVADEFSGLFLHPLVLSIMHTRSA